MDTAAAGVRRAETMRALPVTVVSGFLGAGKTTLADPSPAWKRAEA